jgi:hypothetical protein
MGDAIKALFLCLALCAGAVPARAEMRMWTDSSGRRFKAEFIQELFESVTLKTAAGKELDIKTKDLSPDDLDYVRTRIPPAVEISFSKKTRRKERSIYARPDDTIEIVTGIFTFKKERDPPYWGTLTADVFMIGREVATPDVYVLLGKKRENFTLTREDEETHVLEVPVEARRYPEYNNVQTRGAEFVGYAVMISDQSGNRIARLSNLDWMTGDKIEALGAFRVHGFFDQDAQKAPVPRPEYYNTRILFGRSKLKTAK